MAFKPLEASQRESKERLMRFAKAQNLARILSELGVSSRASRILDEACVDSVDKLFGLTKSELSKKRNCGTKTVAEILNLAAYLRGDAIPEAMASETSEQTVERRLEQAKLLLRKHRIVDSSGNALAEVLKQLAEIESGPKN